MLNIRPVSDLRNRFSEVEEDVLSKGEPKLHLLGFYHKTGDYLYMVYFHYHSQ